MKLIIIFLLGLILCLDTNAQQTIDKVKIKDLELPNETASRAMVLDSNKKAKGSSTITETELNYLDGLSNSLVTLLSGKQDTISLTANRAVISNGSGALAASAVTDTEVGYLSGVTSSIQTQINSKAADSDVVKLTGAQSVGGLKTFTDDIHLEKSSGTARIYISAPTASDPKILSFRTNAVQRWALRVDGTGDNLAIRRYDDAGSFVDAPITLNRSSGQIDFSKKLAVSGTTFATIPCPVMNGTQRDAISSPAEGDCVYNSTTDKLNLYTGSAWQAAGNTFVAAVYTTNAGLSVTTANETTILYEDSVFDTNSAYNTGTGNYTIPSDGYYSVHASMMWDTSASWNVTEYSSIRIYVNGVFKADGEQMNFTTTASNVAHRPLNVFWMQQFTAGDTISIRVFQNTGSTVSVRANGTYNRLMIKKED